jgi:uncharacterized alkaline shock family protein YloU
MGHVQGEHLHVTSQPLPGRTLATRRTVAELVQRAAAASYGVVGFSDPDLRSRVLSRLGRHTRGLRVQTAPTLDVELFIRVAFGVPIAQVASNVESAVRYAVRQGLGREVNELIIHVDGLQVRRAAPPADDQGGAARE